MPMITQKSPYTLFILDDEDAQSLQDGGVNSKGSLRKGERKANKEEDT